MKVRYQYDETALETVENYLSHKLSQIKDVKVFRSTGGDWIYGDKVNYRGFITVNAKVAPIKTREGKYLDYYNLTIHITVTNTCTTIVKKKTFSTPCEVFVGLYTATDKKKNLYEVMDAFVDTFEEDHLKPARSRLKLLKPKTILPPKIKSSEITYERVNLGGIGSILIPSNMEIQSGIYKELSDQTSKTIDADVSGQIIFQQAGRNDTLKKSDTYARLMLANIQGEPGEFSKITSKLVLTKQELTFVDNELKKGIENSFKLSKIDMKMLRWDGTSIETINGRSALKIAYLRQLELNPPVYVEMYMIENYDVMYRLTISYRVEEGRVWKTTLEKVKNSFTVTNVRR